MRIFVGDKTETDIMHIQSNTVLITGACSGIGKIMARICLEKGARQVIIWDINEKAIDATVAELSPLGSVRGFRADISDAQSVQAAYEQTRAACGQPVSKLQQNWVSTWKKKSNPVSWPSLAGRMWESPP